MKEGNALNEHLRSSTVPGTRLSTRGKDASDADLCCVYLATFDIVTILV